MGLIRFLLALAVVSAHVEGNPLLGMTFFGGEGVSAVSCFFMISGFYMALVLNQKYQGNLSGFYRARFLRLYPLYLATLAIFFACQAASWLAGKPMGVFYNPQGVFYQPWEYAWVVISNLAFVGSDLVILHHYAAHSDLNGLILLPVIWSLAVEMTFYLMAPFVVRRPLKVLAALCLLAGLIRFLIAWQHDFAWTVWNYYFFPSALVFFFSGALMQRIGSQPMGKRFFQSRGAGVFTWILLAAAVAWGSHWAPLRDLGLLYLLMGLGLPAIFSLTKDWRWDRAVGELSYPLYLTHCGLLAIYPPFRHWVQEPYKIYFLTAASLILSVGLLKLEPLLRRGFVRLAGKSRPIQVGIKEI